MSELTHLNPAGEAHMVDVGGKQDSARVASAAGEVHMSAEAFDALVRGNLKKGDALGVARIAGIMAAKRTSELIPLCHPIALTKVDVQLEPIDGIVKITATVACTGKTGVEMEALTAVSTAALTIYDMCKAIDKRMVIGNIRLISKTGGNSGDIRNE